MERGLDLSHQNLGSFTHIPESIVRHVERDGAGYSLNVSRNQLEMLVGIHVFRNVCHLNLSSNHLTELHGLNALGALETLNVSDNALVSIDGVVSLHRLRELDVSSNELTNLDTLWLLKCLMVINASNNHLAEWPRFAGLPVLETLSLSGNLLNSFQPSDVADLFPASLKRLALARNRLQELCGVATLGNHVRGLQTLQLAGNPVVQLIESEHGSMQYMTVNLFPNIVSEEDSPVTGRRPTNQPSHGNYAVPKTVALAVFMAAMRGNEQLLRYFLTKGDIPTSTETHTATNATPSLQLPSAAPRALTSHEKMQIMDRFMAVRRLETQQHATKKTSKAEQPVSDLVRSASVVESSHASPPVVHPSPPPSLPTPPPPPSVAIGTADLSLLVRPARDHSTASVTMADLASHTPPNSSAADGRSSLSHSFGYNSTSRGADQAIMRLKLLEEQVANMRKYVNVWVKREQMTRHAAAKRIQRCLRRSRMRAFLQRQSQQRRWQRGSEYIPRPCSNGTTWHDCKEQIPMWHLHVHLSALTIQRYARGWLIRMRTTRWKKLLEAARCIERAWTAWRMQTREVKRLDLHHLFNPGRAGPSQGRGHQVPPFLADALLRLSRDLQQIQRTSVVQGRAITRVWETCERYERFFQSRWTRAIVSLQSAWRGRKVRHAMKLYRRDDSRRARHAAAFAGNGRHDTSHASEVASLRHEIDALKRIVNELVNRGS